MAKVNETNKIFRVKGVVRSKRKKGDKKIQKNPKKDLTEPTLLEIPGKSKPPKWMLVQALEIQLLKARTDCGHGSHKG